MLLFVPCRLGPTAYYAGARVARAPPAYHAAAAAFTLFSVGWAGLLVLQYGADVRNFSRRRKRVDAEDPAAPASLPLVAAADLAAVAAAAQPAVLLAIDGVVYNVGAPLVAGRAGDSAKPTTGSDLTDKP